MPPHEMAALYPFVLPVLILIVLTAICAVATALVAFYGRKRERRTWRFRAVLGVLSGLLVSFYLVSSGVLEYAASRLGYEAEWTASVFVQYAIELTLVLFVIYVAVRNLRLATKGRALEEATKSRNV